jgi:two-component system sensor histidine kinase PhoQ
MLSLNLRVLIAASIVLVSFFGIAGVTLDRAYYVTAEEALIDRLQGQIYTLIATTGLDDNNNIVISDSAEDVLYFMAGPDLYAQIALNNGDSLWRSQSLVKHSLSFATGLKRNEMRFNKVTLDSGQAFAALSYGVGWDDTHRQEVFIYSVAENLESFQKKIDSYRNKLWGLLGGVGLVLLIVQGTIMRWGLAPLQVAAAELSAIESGKQHRLYRKYPGELNALTDNLNALLDHQNEHLERYRHTLGDLAHSLKTPLAVLQSSIEEPVNRDELTAIVQEQVERMNQITEYQLQRAAAAGQSPLIAPISVHQVSEKILSSLQKVYADKQVRVHSQVTPGLEFHGDEGDYMEVVGNLLDNAFKWCKNQINLQITKIEKKDILHDGIMIVVEDDGPGIPQKLARQVTQRGVRADEGIKGHGIGLSVVQDIVQIYGGVLSIRTSKLGGASISATLMTKF